MTLEDKSVSKVEAVTTSDGKKEEPAISLMVDVPKGVQGTEILITKHELKKLLAMCG